MKEDGEEQEDVAGQVAAHAQGQEVGDRVGEHEAEHGDAGRDDQAPLEYRQPHAGEELRVGSKREGGPDPESGPLPEAPHEHHAERHQQRAGDERERQTQQRVPRDGRQEHARVCYAALKRAHSDSYVSTCVGQRFCQVPPKRNFCRTLASIAAISWASAGPNSFGLFFA